MKPLPVWELTVASYSRVIRDFGYALRICGPWILLLIVIVLVTGSLVGSDPVRSVSDTTAHMGEDITLGSLLLRLLPLIVYPVALASIAVLWHRMMLLDETSDASFPFRLDRPVWLYIGYGLLIMVIVVLPAFVFTQVVIGMRLFEGPRAAVAGLVAVIVFLAVLTAGLRLSLVLPAVSVGRKGFGIADAWEVTQGNGLRLLAVTLLIGLGMMVVGLLLGLVAGAVAALVGGLADIITVLVNVLGTLVTVSSLSLAYGFLVEDRPIER